MTLTVLEIPNAARILMIPKFLPVHLMPSRLCASTTGGAS